VIHIHSLGDCQKAEVSKWLKAEVSKWPLQVFSVYCF
jgi:hypothetical protein